MRLTLLSTLPLLIGSAACAQLTILPQVGFERSRTPLQVNNAPSFTPLEGEGTLKANVRIDYQFKKWGGPFVGIGTSPAVVAYSFMDPATAETNFRAATSHLQWRLEGGYQYNSKPLYFKKSTASNTLTNISTQNSTTQKSCGSYSCHSRCGEKNRQEIARVKDERLNMHIQPSAGMAYKPGTKQDLERNGALYQYNAGNWNTAFISGIGFEFAKGVQRQFNLGVHYTKGLGNLNTQNLTTQQDSKTMATQLRSDASSWAVTLGVPFTLMQKKPAQVKVIDQQKTENRSKCDWYYHSRCTRKVVI